MFEPPFAILGAAHTNPEGKSPSESLIEELVKLTLLPPGKVRWWFSHLETTEEIGGEEHRKRQRPTD